MTDHFFPSSDLWLLTYRASAASRREGEPMRIEQFEDIEAWQLARELTRKVNERKLTLNGEPLAQTPGPDLDSKMK